MGAIIRTVLFLLGAALFYLWMQRDNRTAEEAAEETLDEVEKQLDVVKEAVRDAKEHAKERVEEGLEYANLEPEDDDAQPTREIVEVPPAEIMPVSEVVTEPIAAEDIPAAAATGEPDDLTLIEGVGPAYRDLLVNSGIDTFAKLAAMSEDEIVTLIRDNGGRKSASMATWAQQAKFAAAGDWAGLQRFKDTLTGGRK